MPSKQWPSLDVFRGIAVILMLVNHAAVGWLSEEVLVGSDEKDNMLRMEQTGGQNRHLGGRAIESLSVVTHGTTSLCENDIIVDKNVIFILFYFFFLKL